MLEVAPGPGYLAIEMARLARFRVTGLDISRTMSSRPGGLAVIQDLCREAPAADIDREVRRQGLGVLNGFVTRRILAGLRNRAYSTARFERLVAGSRFHGCAIEVDGIGLEVRLEKPASS